MDVKQCRDQADKLFGSRSQLMGLWQEISDNFYPERGGFTLRMEPGDEYASHLYTSYPLLVRRELGDQFGMMLRPTNKHWFRMTVEDQDRINHDELQWLQWAEKMQRAAMNSTSANFQKAAKQADHDFAAFGQAVIQVRLNRTRSGLMFKNHHIKDSAWRENEEGHIDFFVLKKSIANIDMVKYFGDRCHPTTKEDVKKKPFDMVNCYHIVISADNYTGDSRNKPWVSIYYDCDHNKELEVLPVLMNEYVVPRWQTISNSQYAFSPASICGLPDARLIQSMSFTLLQAGEKMVNPPLIGTQDAIRSDVGIFPGGITWIDRDYDERLGEALRPMNINANGMPIGLDMLQDARTLIKEAFFLNKIGLPERGAEMTAYEIGQRVQEYIRGALPIFHPMEAEYSGRLCETIAETLVNAGGFGPVDSIPENLRGQKIKFIFESPLYDAIEEQKGHKFLEMKGLILEAMALDQQAVALPDAKQALREVLKAINVPASWTRSETTVNQMLAAQEALKQAQQQMGDLQQGSEIIKNISPVVTDSQAA